ncbi:YopX family protein [Helicobacter sp.]|uniref:YopX family protein n=1 Tax=Helicobacter sp. TaxID=218 RepID=UPI0019A235A9|nr:YopX family protein [Helicobacter sp.]MBD5164370.1 hypothetical protein [Helicobacter sp.]
MKKNVIARGEMWHIQVMRKGRRIRFSTKLKANKENKEYILRNFEKLIEEYLNPPEFLNMQKNSFALFATDEIEMWSGYTDSTGKRIYENDLVEVNNEGIDISFVGVVKFCKDSKAFEVESNALADIFDFKCEVEVVGYKE